MIWRTTREWLHGPPRWPWRPVLLADPCAYCGSPAETVDHVDPRPERDRSPANQTAACWRCNHAKADRPLLLFLLRRVGIIPPGDSRRERRAARREWGSR